MFEAPEGAGVGGQSAGELQVRGGARDVPKEGIGDAAVDDESAFGRVGDEARIQFFKGRAEVALSGFAFAEGQPDAGAANEPRAAPARIAEFPVDLFESRFVLTGIDHGVDAFFLKDGAAGFGKAGAQVAEA